MEKLLWSLKISSDVTLEKVKSKFMILQLIIKRKMFLGLFSGVVSNV